jgi:hypothetical protein
MDDVRERYIASLQREVDEQERMAKEERHKYFLVTNKFYFGLQAKTGHFIELDVEKINGEKRTLRGVLGYSEAKGKFVVNEDCDGSKEGLRSFNHYRIMRIKLGNKEYFPKGHTNESDSVATTKE